MKEVFLIVLLIIGALVGAGFASGQEIYSFFYSYGKIGIVGIIITCCLISLTIYKSLKIIYSNKIDNYDEFLRIFIPNKNVTKVISIMINILLLVTFYIMIAGFGAYFEQEIGVNRFIGSFVLVIMTAVVFFTNVKGVMKVSEYVVPLLIFFIIIIGGKNLLTITPNLESLYIKKGWLISGIIYCSYNMILLIPVLISIRKQITKKENIKYISILCGIFMIIMSVLLYMLLMRADVQLSSLEMPIVYVIRTCFKNFKTIYAFIILISIFTTAISIGIGILQNVNDDKGKYTCLVIFMCLTGLVVSNVGFSRLVNLMYPFFRIYRNNTINIYYKEKMKKYCKK